MTRCGNTQRQLIFEEKDTGAMTSDQSAQENPQEKVAFHRKSAHFLSRICNKIMIIFVSMQGYDKKD